jgi:HSP20 family protein
MTIGALIRNHPARAAVAALRDAERAFGAAQRIAPAQLASVRTAPGFEPRIQAVESEDEYRITAELPGVEREDLSVEVEDGVLTLKGLRKGPGWSAELSEDEQARHVVRFTRRIRFNGEIDEAAVTARYRNGLLTVAVPKARVPEQEVRTIPVEVV